MVVRDLQDSRELLLIRVLGSSPPFLIPAVVEGVLWGGWKESDLDPKPSTVGVPLLGPCITMLDSVNIRESLSWTLLHWFHEGSSLRASLSDLDDLLAVKDTYHPWYPHYKPHIIPDTT